jgi:hypothetical protein
MTRAEEPSHVDRGQPDPATCTENDQSLPRSDACPLVERVQSRPGGHQEPGRRTTIHARREHGGAVGGDRHALAGHAVFLVARHPIAPLDVGDAGPHRSDDPRVLAAR